MIQSGSEVPGMAKPKETQIPMEENNISKLNMTPIFIIFINRIIFSSIELHPCKKIQWSCKNTTSLHKNTNENISL